DRLRRPAAGQRQLPRDAGQPRHSCAGAGSCRRTKLDAVIGQFRRAAAAYIAHKLQLPVIHSGEAHEQRHRGLHSKAMRARSMIPAAASRSRHEVMITGIAGLVSGAMSMVAGEYVSVSSQSDTEEADSAREHRELAEQPEAELAGLTQIYVERGV